MIVRAATVEDVPELVRLKALLMETGWPFPVSVAGDAGWRARAEEAARGLVVDPMQGWFVVDGLDDVDGPDEVHGGAPQVRNRTAPVLAACVSVSLTQHLPGPRGTGIAAYLGDMVTEPRFQGRGIGTRLLGHAVAWARERGAGRIELHSTESGRAVYERAGFEAASPFTHLTLRLR